MPSDRRKSDNTRPPRRELDGVIYEPSGRADRTPPRRSANASSAGRRPANRRPSGTTPRRGGRNPRKKNRTPFAAFYIVTLLAGVAVCLILFAMAFQSITQNNPAVEGTVKSTATPPPGMESRDFKSLIGMVTAVSTRDGARGVTLLDIGTGRAADYTLTDATEIKNRFGSALAFSELRVGSIAEAGYDGQTMALTSLTESAQAWEYKFKSNVKIDPEQSTLTIGNEIYNFGSQTLSLYRGEAYPIGHIMPIDTVTVTGWQDRVWCVVLENNHGYLRIENTDKVVNGTLAVDTSVFMGLEDAGEPVALAEGTHRVIVEGANIEPFISDVVIKPNETASVNLIDVALKKAFLSVNVNEPYSTIVIDGETLSEAGPAELEFGTHSVRVEKDGFIPVQQEVTLTKAYTEITVELTKIAKNGRLIITTEPSQAEIYMNNEFIGYSTLTYDVELGTHNIIAKKSGYTDKSISVTVAEGDNAYYIILTEPVYDPFTTQPNVIP